MTPCKTAILRIQGGPDSFSIESVNLRLPQSDEIQIRVHAAALNRGDTMFRKGAYPLPQTPFVLGAEVSGVVHATGGDVRDWQTGDRICALMPYGGYAEYVNVHKDLCFQLPDHLSHVEAAAIPEVFVTAYQLLRWVTNTRKGDTVLIHAAGSGVGTAALQIARAMGIAVIATTRSAHKVDICRSLGAQHVILVQDSQFSEQVREITLQKGVDVVLDPVGRSYLRDNLAVLRPEGTLVLYGDLDSEFVEVDLGPIFDKWLHVVGTTFQTRSFDYKRRLINEMLEFLRPLLKDGKVQPIIDSTFTLENVSAAHSRLESNNTIGKIILEIRQDT